MAISAAGVFNYEIVLGRSSGTWSGQAAPPSSDSRHPGLVGSRPDLELSNGMVTLRRTVSALYIAKAYTEFRKPVLWASFSVGTAIEAVAEEGDMLRVFRGATGDLGITLFRGDDFLMGLGAVSGLRLAPTMTVHEDPRAFEVNLYHLIKTIDRPDTTLVWLDSADPDVDTTIRTLDQLPGERLVIAITGPGAEEQRNVHHRVAGAPFSSSRHASREYVDVDRRFTDREQWLDYLRLLPKTRPTDLYLRFHFDGQDIDVREGKQAFKRPWHLFVAKVYTPGLPGAWSQLAVVREHQAVDVPMVIDSTRLIASNLIEMTR